MSDPAPLRSREHWFALLLCLAAPLALLALGWALEPDPRGWGTHEQLGFRPCYPMTHWNVPCPGCGVTTAVALSVRGRIGPALVTQPLGPLLLLAAFSLAGWALAGHGRGLDLGARLARVPWGRIARGAGLVLLLAWSYKLALARGWL